MVPLITSSGGMGRFVHIYREVYSDSDRSGILYQALYVLVQRLITSLTKCQTRCCIEPRPSVAEATQ